MDHITKEFLNTIPSSNQDPWMSSVFNNWQKLPVKKKGETGELYIQHVLQSYGYDVQHIGGGADHDLHDLTNDIKLEVKTSFANKHAKQKDKITSDDFTWNHVGVDKGWDVLVLVGINHEDSECRYTRRGWREITEDVVIRFLPRSVVMELIDNGSFRAQQGGKDSGNDDWMLDGSVLKNNDYLAEYTDYIPS